MNILIRRKKQFVAVAALLTVVIVAWGAFVFTAMWLRARYASELAKIAQELDEVELRDQASSDNAPILGTYFLNTGAEPATNKDTLVTRLEELQRLNLRTVLRNIPGLKSQENQPRQLALVQSITLTQTNQNQSAFQIVGEQASGQQTTVTATIDLNTGASPTTAGQLATQVLLWRPDQSNQVYSATDSRGEKVLIVTRAVDSNGNGEPEAQVIAYSFGRLKPAVDSNGNAEPEARPARELLLIDSAGQILNRSLIDGHSIVGKLPDPLGLADQIVIGTLGYGNTRSGQFKLSAVGASSIRIIDRGTWKTVRTIEAPRSAPADQDADTSPGK